MTERERFLSILVGGLLAITLVWWGFGKYNAAVKSRNNQIAQLQQQQQKLNEQRLQGEYANRQMGEYMIRSLPGEPIASHGSRPRNTSVGATLAHGTAFGRR